MITGATAKGFTTLAKDSGALIEEFYEKMESITEADKLIDLFLEEIDTDNFLGLTRGGNHFVSEAEMRQIEFDGSRVRFKGDSVKDTVNPRIETTLLEFKLENLRRIMPSSDVTKTGGRTTIRERLRIDPEDYMKSLSWIRERADGAIIVFTLFSPMNQGSVDVSGADKNEGELPVTFTAFNDDFADLEYAPYALDIFETVVTP